MHYWQRRRKISRGKKALRGKGNIKSLCFTRETNIMLCVHAKLLSHVQLFATLWTIGHQAPLSMGFSRQGYWSGLPCPPPGDLPNPGIGTRVSLCLLYCQVGSLPLVPPDVMLFVNYISIIKGKGSKNCKIHGRPGITFPMMR